MKTLYILLFGLLVSGGVMAQPCLPEGITFETQAQIDSFQINYPNCTEIEGSLLIGLYPSNEISNLDSLYSLTLISGDLGIMHNYSLYSLSGLENIDTIIGQVSIYGNNELTNLNGLNNLKHIGESLGIGIILFNGMEVFSIGNDNLETLSGMNNIMSIEGGLGVFGNSSLTNISELINVNSVDGGIYLWQNNSLENISGLSNIDASSIDTLSISENHSLSMCEIESICDYLLNPNTVPYINDNATGCNSQEEIEVACENASVDELSQNNRLLIYPNPSSTQITIELPTTPNKNTTLTICNLNGQQLITQPITERQTVVDVSVLPRGVYFIKVMDDTGVMKVGKVVKE